MNLQTTCNGWLEPLERSGQRGATSTLATGNHRGHCHYSPHIILRIENSILTKVTLGFTISPLPLFCTLIFCDLVFSSLSALQLAHDGRPHPNSAFFVSSRLLAAFSRTIALSPSLLIQSNEHDDRSDVDSTCRNETRGVPGKEQGRCKDRNIRILAARLNL